MFIQTEATPNPATLKFIPGRTVLDTGTMEFANREAAARSPLAERLFDVSGVSGVFYGYDFVTVTKADGDWQHLKPAILGAIMEHYMSGAPLLADGTAGNDEATDEEGEFFNEADADTVATIKDLIETRVRPAVANDGGAQPRHPGDIGRCLLVDLEGRRCIGRPAVGQNLRRIADQIWRTKARRIERFRDRRDLRLDQ